MGARGIGRRGITVAIVALLAALALWARVPLAQAITEAEKSFLSLYFTPEELQVVSATRSLQSIARIAENVTVVTAADIELMNAHTMEQVLGSVPGVTTNNAVQFITSTNALIQGPDMRHVTVLLNGIPQNNLSENAAVLGIIPVTDIEKVEIIRGPASSVWGSAMGGVVNIITKGPGAKAFQGTVSLDYGTKNSGDYRAAVTGKVGSLGYYLSGTWLRTDGLIEGFDADAGHLGARLDYAFTDRTSASFTLFSGDTNDGDGVDHQYDLSWGQLHKHLVSQLGVTSGIGQAGRLDLNLWTTRFDDEFFMNQLSDGTELSRFTFKENRTGVGARYSVKFDSQDVVAGVDYSKGTLDASNIEGADPERDQWAVYANDTITFGKLTITPGLRYDDISTTDSFWSPSLGATYLLFEDTLLRATIARGFNVPNMSSIADSGMNMYRGNPDLTVETMWSYQLGFESGILDALWLKVSAYQHDVEDAIQDTLLENDWWTRVNAGRQRRRGIDVELRTKPVHNLTLAGSSCFLEVKDLDTDENVMDLPTATYDVSLKYDDQKSFRALLKGRYLRWELVEGRNGDMSGFIVDFDVAKKFAVSSGVSLEAFISVHNLLDETQRVTATYPNPDRWVEGGIRASF